MVDGSGPGPAFDAEALQRKYRQERDKRLRGDGNAQYISIRGRHDELLVDPHRPVEPRAPLSDQVDFLIIGGGFGGLLFAARLQEAGYTDLRLLDSAGDFGGTWYWNRYPGLACDIESYTYLPLLEETGHMPAHKYVTGPEILEHAQRIGRHYDLYPRAVFHTRVQALRWDEDAAVWHVTTDRGDDMRARHVAMALGPLCVPKLPGVPGIERFRGHSFHTSRWDYDYTGGGPDGDLSGLRDKRVGLIGTGATSVQVVPHLGASAEHLYVFQRTPSAVDVKRDSPTDPEWAKSLQPGWQQRRMDNFNTMLSGGWQDEDLVRDGWTSIWHGIVDRILSGDPAYQGDEALQKASVDSDFETMERIRQRAEALVEDPAAAEALKPYYRQLCKRPCFHNDYLQTFNRDNVTLVDTEGQGVTEITERGVIANGRAYELDCLIYASGFEVGTPYVQRAGYDIIGRGGRRLSEHWQDGVRSLHGAMVHGFPNCFVISGAQAGFTASYPHMLAEQATHMAYVRAEADKRGARSFEPSAEAEQRWVEATIRASGLRAEFLQECTPGYYNNEGKPGERAAQDGFYGGGSVRFIEILRQWRNTGELPGVEFSPGTDDTAAAE